MNILIFNPSFNPHGGIRVIIEWANHLKRLGHHVVLHTVEDGVCDWINIEPGIVHLSGKTLYPRGYDHIIATTPQFAHAMAKHKDSGKVWYFMQMAEELFSDNPSYQQQCISSYYLGLPIITISHWIEYRLRMMGVTTPIYQVGNGWDQSFVPGVKDEKPTVLVANWQGFNPCKDVEEIGPKTAKYLKQKYGMSVLSFSGSSLSTLPNVPDEFYHKATTPQLVSLYQRAWFTIQATRIDAWSTVGMESLSCHTPLIRGIVCGDEYLRHNYNCLKGGYHLDEMIYLADQAYNNSDLSTDLTGGTLETLTMNSWNRWMTYIESLLLNNPN